MTRAGVSSRWAGLSALTRPGLGFGLVVGAAFATAAAPLASLEHKSLATSITGAALATIDVLGLRWQIPALRDARADWVIGRAFTGWARRRVFNRYGANLIRSIALPMALALALAIFLLPQPVPRSIADPVGSFEGFLLALYVFASEVGFAILAQRDYSAIHDPARAPLKEERARQSR